jgi:hypothetical protein
MRLLVFAITGAAALLLSAAPSLSQTPYLTANVSVVGWRDANGKTSAQGTVTSCPVSINFGTSFTWSIEPSAPYPWSQPIKYYWITGSVVGGSENNGPTLTLPAVNPAVPTGLRYGNYPFKFPTWTWTLGANGPALGGVTAVNMNGQHEVGLQIISPDTVFANLSYFTLTCPNAIGIGPKGNILRSSGLLIFGAPPTATPTLAPTPRVPRTPLPTVRP